MSRSNVKNLIILILLLVNGFLLALVLPSRLSDLRQRQQARESLAQLYEQAGVTLSAADIPDTKALYAMDLPMEFDGISAASAVLGDQMLSTGTELSSSLGHGTLTEDGTLSLTVTDAAPAADPEVHTRQLLADMGVSFQTLRRSTPYPNAEVYTASFAASRVPLFSHSLTFLYEDGSLKEISGTLPSRAEPRRTGTAVCVSAEDALVAFLSRRLEVGWMGSSILSVTQGYHPRWVPAQNLFRLQPAWCIRTDSGDYLVDGLTCSVTILE